MRLRWKNELVEPLADIEDVISFATRPRRTLEDFEKHRENFEDWKHAKCLTSRAQHIARQCRHRGVARLPAPFLMIVNDRCDDAPEFVSAARPARHLIVAVAGGHSIAHQVGGPNRIAKSLKSVKPASLAERAALARIERVIEPAQAELTTVAHDQPRAELNRLDQARIKRWIANQLINWPPTSCLHCRKPTDVGRAWTTLANDGVSARFHQSWSRRMADSAGGACARKALGSTAETAR